MTPQTCHSFVTLALTIVVVIIVICTLCFSLLFFPFCHRLLTQISFCTSAALHVRFVEDESKLWCSQLVGQLWTVSVVQQEAWESKLDECVTTNERVISDCPD